MARVHAVSESLSKLNADGSSYRSGSANAHPPWVHGRDADRERFGRHDQCRRSLDRRGVSSPSTCDVT